MLLQNLKHADDTATFAQAVLRGIGRDNGLYFPMQWPQLEAHALLPMNFQQRSALVLHKLIGDDMAFSTVQDMVERAFTFAPVLKPIDEHTDVLELFHGPTLAFKDFGARFMAQVLGHFIATKQHQGPLTILSATSGDTGAAVAHAFRNIPGIQVIILYPHGRISSMQEKMFCTLGGNIHTLAVNGDFDQCQALVKRAFTDADFVKRYGLNSANSINISRLYAQVCYYVEAWAQLSTHKAVGDFSLCVSVPSGNFGNLTAGLIAKRIGIPLSRFVAATNNNDTVPRYLHNGQWQVNRTQATLSNAMDVSDPSNWPRTHHLLQQWPNSTDIVSGVAVNETETIAAMHSLHQQHYIADPHTAVAYAGLQHSCQKKEYGLFLSTAHPAKFKETVEQQLSIHLPLPPELVALADKPLLSKTIQPEIRCVREAIELAHQ